MDLSISYQGLINFLSRTYQGLINFLSRTYQFLIKDLSISYQGLIKVIVLLTFCAVQGWKLGQMVQQTNKQTNRKKRGKTHHRLFYMYGQLNNSKPPETTEAKSCYVSLLRKCTVIENSTYQYTTNCYRSGAV